MKVTKHKAKWLPKPMQLLKQLYVSLISYITLPFFRERENGIQKFFIKQYSESPDDLVFDGNTNRYFDKILEVCDRISNKIIVDLGCGTGSFYRWLCNHNILVEQYIGFDFAIQDKVIDSIAHIKYANLEDFESIMLNKNTLVVVCNTLCYMTSDKIGQLLNKLGSEIEILIIEPTQNIFWDAHFNGVKPIYRSHEKLIEMLSNYGISVDVITLDYWSSICGKYCIEMSYMLYCRKK